MSLILDDTVVAFKKEVTEGVWLAPSSATDGFIETIKGGIELTPARALIERNILSGSLAAATPRKGMRSVSGKLNFELKGGGSEGAAPDFGAVMETIFGATHSISSTTTTKSGNTTSVLQIQDADISKYSVGDIIVLKKTGAHHIAAITAKTTGTGTATVTFSPVAPGSIPDGCVISKSQMYTVADSGHPTLAASIYWGNGFLEKAMGVRMSGMTLQNFKTGMLPSLDFKWEGMNYDRVANTSSPYTPSYSAALPAVVLGAKIYQGGTEIQVEDLALSLDEAIGWLTSTGDANGRIAGRVAQKRKVKGSFAPYVDTTVGNFTTFDTTAAFSLFVRLFNPSSTAGEFEFGSIVGIWMPNCVFATDKIDGGSGVLVEKMEFIATGGANGDQSEIYMGFI